MAIRDKRIIHAIVPVFLLFSVGFPIIVASCPMEKEDGAMFCTACAPVSRTSDAAESFQPNSSCCTTVITGIRTDVQYLKSVYNDGPAFSLQNYSSTDKALVDRDHRFSVTPDDPTGYIRDDIPILTSSLLI